MAAASFRYGLTITGAVLLVTGTLCFAWWSDGEVGSGSGARLLPPREAEAVPSSSSSSALLRSVSFFCCGIGGILLIFGLLWSVKANARVVSRRYQYHFPRDLQYFTAEPPEKWNCRWEPRPWVGRGGGWMGLAVPEAKPAPSSVTSSCSPSRCSWSLMSTPAPAVPSLAQLHPALLALQGHHGLRDTSPQQGHQAEEYIGFPAEGLGVGAGPSSSPSLPGLQCSVRMRVVVTSLMEAKIFLARELNGKKK